MTHQKKAFSFPLFSAKRRPKAAVQAFKDRQKQKKRFPGGYAHYGRPIT
jgi:hypothetical protein